MELQSFDNVVVWAILILALFVYYKLSLFIVVLRSQGSSAQDQQWIETLRCLINALPLLGLLGTIMGLLQSFFAMSQGGSLSASSVLTQGIANALWTTQLGLVLAVPAWLLLSYFNNLLVKESLANAR
ncbi:MotA/TolQ/ExbB proton channel family protein [Pseudoalteromonas tunicata]|uniref:MotA/TolQ/ExbB proton channel family protein n=1 Tax=Pseudoalteromonas tunicata TaxID=314281 RepID=UPI00273D4035|nr:MotA/TolQ/ExbB proton channel family protein [Pseudoalteromonas tunicata]MDP4984572.1 MotA/TolQ/ExbB proton channel family protein [Pseudoalteromonas tunicata]